MTPDCILIQQPAVDFTRFLTISLDALGQNLASASDSSPKQQSDAERFLSCLAAMQDERAPAGIRPALMGHVSFSALVVMDDRDALGILQASGGMPIVVAETVKRGIVLAVMTGTLAQWQVAVKTGTDPDQDANVRACYGKLLVLFEQAGLNVWQGYHRKATGGGLICLERK